jgi:membrane fusion protein (multidrug efflux system)
VGTAEILGLEVDPTTGTIPVRATFSNPGNVLRPGQYARVRLAVFVAKGALLIPQQAVSDTQGLLQVWVVNPDDTVSLRTVKMSERVGADWIVESGLEAGQRVVVEGLEKVKAGAKVAPTAWEPPPPAPSRPLPPALPSPVGAGKSSGK